MKDEIIDRILSIDIKVLTNENKEVIVRYTDFKDLDNMTIRHDYADRYSNNFCYRQSLEGVGFDVSCQGYSIEIEECEKKDKSWRPKFDEKYYSIGVDGAVEDGVWMNDFLDYSLYKLGNCYRTIEEARANRSKWGKFYDSEGVLSIKT